MLQAGQQGHLVAAMGGTPGGMYVCSSQPSTAEHEARVASSRDRRISSS